MTDEQMHDRLRAAGERWRSSVDIDGDDRAEPVDLIVAEPPRRRRAVLAVAAAVVLIAVAATLLAIRGAGNQDEPTGGAVPAELQGVTWTNRVSGSTIVFSLRSARIQSSCESATYHLTTQGRSMVVGDQIGTASACGGGPWPQAIQRAIDVFDRVVRHGRFSWSFDGGTLRLAARGSAITLTTNGKRAPNVEHQTWYLYAVTDAHGHPITTSDPTSLTFDEGSRRGFRGGDTCSVISGAVSTTLTTIDFRKQRQTASGCWLGDEKPVIDKLLDGVTDYQIIGDELVLSRDGYRGRLVYRTEADSPHLVPQAAQPPYGTWRLVHISTPRGWYASHTKPYVDTRLTIARVANRSGAGSGAEFVTRPLCGVVQGRSAWKAHSVQFSFVHIARAAPCATDVPPAAANAAAAQASAVNHILSGSAVFNVNHGRLTITRLGVGTLVYVHQ